MSEKQYAVLVVVGAGGLLALASFLASRRSDAATAPVTANTIATPDGPVLEEITVTAERLRLAANTTDADPQAPRGVRNNNPGNLRFIASNPFLGQVGKDAQGFGIYSSAALGIRAAAANLWNYFAAGRDTVREIISAWAPPSDNNDTEAYIRAVASALKVTHNQPLDFRTHAPGLLRAIFRHELGGVYYTDAQIRQGIIDTGRV